MVFGDGRSVATMFTASVSCCPPANDVRVDDSGRLTRMIILAHGVYPSQKGDGSVLGERQHPRYFWGGLQK